MQVHTNIDQPPQINRAVITIGTFDGVHLGHQKIINQLKAEAKTIGGETVIITFHPHPRKIVNEDSIKLITTIEERQELLRNMGVDHLVVVPFTTEFSELSPRQYVEDFLVARFRPSVVIIGYDHKFGNQRRGDYKLLEDYAAKGLFELREIPQRIVNHITVSSTQIRDALQEGLIDKANELLGYAFFFEGTVVKGDQRGRTIGFPTANIELSNPEKIVPGNGVYVVEVDIADTSNQRCRGMMNIGFRPTVQGTTRTVEVNILDFSEDIYGKKLRVTLRKFLRPEKKFSGLEELKSQLAQDREQSIHYFGG